MVRDLWGKRFTKEVSFEFRVKGWWMGKVEKRRMDWGKDKEVRLVHKVKMEVYSRDSFQNVFFPSALYLSALLPFSSFVHGVSHFTGYPGLMGESTLLKTCCFSSHRRNYCKLLGFICTYAYSKVLLMCHWYRFVGSWLSCFRLINSKCFTSGSHLCFTVWFSLMKTKNENGEKQENNEFVNEN